MMKSLKQFSNITILKDICSITILFLITGVFIITLIMAGKEPVVKKAVANNNDIDNKFVVGYSNAKIKGQMIKLQPAKPIYNYKAYVFNINNNMVTLSEQELYTIIYDYIKANIVKQKNNPVYLNKLTKSYIRLFDECGNNDAVLRFIGLCKIESCFDCHVKSHCGAYGIPQVILRIWHKVMKDNWNITVEDYKSDLYTQIYTGWKIYDVYIKKNKGNISKAHSQYSGGARGYHNKVIKQNNILKAKIIKASK